MATRNVRYECDAPLTYTRWLRIAHASKETDQSVDRKRRDIEDRQMAHVWPVALSHNKVVPSGLDEVIFQSADSRVYVMRRPPINHPIGKVVHGWVFSCRGNFCRILDRKSTRLNSSPLSNSY